MKFDLYSVDDDRSVHNADYTIGINLSSEEHPDDYYPDIALTLLKSNVEPGYFVNQVIVSTPEIEEYNELGSKVLDFILDRPIRGRLPEILMQLEELKKQLEKDETEET